MDLISTYANGVSELANFSKNAESSPLIVDLIVNPHAGFFRRKSTVGKMILELEARLDELRSRFPRRKVEINTVHFTEHAGHARTITEDILNDEERARSGIEHLLIGCGGDGTSNEICTTLVEAGQDVLTRLKLVRLPLGSGNDVADTGTFGEAYELILGGQHTEKTGALKVTVGGSGPRYSFNIASVGLDAYIADLTNRFKRAIPGHAYKALVDIGTLFYERHVPPRPMDVRLIGNDGEVTIKGLVPSMVVVGISGGRTYGGHMHVLPGKENVCIVDRMSIPEKVKNKKLFYEGRHGELPQVKFYTAHTVEINYHAGIPMQLDGELTWLTEKDFPLTMRVLPPMIKVLRP
jgi:diacylglycerol kinase family enzyme